MDQLKVVLGHLRKHHFWLLCAICIGAGLFAWWKAAGSLSQNYASRKGAIESKFSALNAIMQEPNFPNDQWRESAEALTEQQKEKVRIAWQQVYDKQAPHLKWPEELGPEFQKIRSQSQAESLQHSQREQYMNYIRDKFPTLLQIIGADRSGKRQEGPDVNTVAVQDKVIWDASDQDKIEKSLKNVGTSSNLQIWLTQEDLWVYQVLLKILNEVNANRYVPPVKEIRRLAIAQDAAKEFERGLKSGIVEMPSNMDGASGTAGAVSSSGMDGAAAGMGIPGGAAAAPAPDQGRYVDAQGNPMPAGTSEQGAFKRMPVYFDLVMDEREISNLLVECANSPLPVEVRQLRVNPEAGTSSKSATTAPGTDATMASNKAISYDVPVQIAGIIYIYNPPDTSRLGTGEAAAAAAAPPGVPGSPPGVPGAPPAVPGAGVPGQ